MQKFFTILCFAMLSYGVGNAQEFIQKVPYRGAFAPSPSPMWTSGWTEFDPQNKVYPATTVTVSSNITTNTTWTANNVYLLQGLIYVQAGVTLTIEPGTIIRGDNTIANSSLAVSKGGKLLAEGTETKPIVFTSNKAVGSRAPGDWGGVILLGKASTNKTGGLGNIEGITAAAANEYGGGTSPDDNDNSGILKYVRIEFGGYVFAANTEINGLTLGAVGKGTTIDYVQCSYINDDSFEWFGGTVNCSHLVAYKGTDDDFDTDNGYSGNVQFALSVRDPQIYDPTYAAASGASTSEGFESDNDATGSTLTPKTKALFTNITIIGPYRGSLSNIIGPGFRRAARIRRNSELKIFNSILLDFPRGLHIDGIGASNTAEANATAGLIKFKNNILAGYEVGRVGEVNSGSTFDIKGFIASNGNDTIPGSTSGVTGILISPYASNDANSDFRPGTLASTGADFTDPAFTGLVINTYFKTVPYRGAFAPSPSPMWTSGWTEFDPQNKVYPATTVTVSSNITTNTTWTANNVYLLQGLIYVQAGVTLTIEPGTIIRGDNTIANSSLAVSKGGKLLAEGTETKPIVFTSNKAVGSRAPGDWGGVILLGKASTNKTGGLGNIEGITAAAANEYGGGTSPDDNDNSGILKYVRIEFGGYVFAANTEINGLTLGAVGKGTTIDYVQCSYINDDSFEWFGGTVNCSHLVAYKGTDDDFDTDNGYSGNVQFALSVRDPQIYDPTYAAASGASTSEGFESDNDATGSTLTPKTKALFTNITIIGPYRGSLSNIIGPGFRRAARIRRNSELKIFNSILLDFPRGLHIDGIGASNTAEANATAGLIKFKNNILAGYEVGRVGEVNSGSTFDIKGFIASNGNDTIPGSTSGVTGILISPYASNDANSDFRPGTLASTGASFTDPAFTNGVLPVTLTSFYGVNAKNDNLLYWETATEINNAGFSVERSVDGINFSAIGYVASKVGNSSIATQYQFTDANAFDGKSYYRLKQVDKDGKYTISSVVELTKNVATSSIAASIYPNPVTDKLNVVIASPKAQFATLVVNDFYGRTLTTKSTTLQAGNNKFDFDVKQLAPGQYVISLLLTDGSKATTQKFIKQ